MKSRTLTSRLWALVLIAVLTAIALIIAMPVESRVRQANAERAPAYGPAELLPDLGGGRSCANGINNLGQIVGWAEDASGCKHAVLWDASGHIHTVSQPEEAGAIALAINDSGVIAGQVPTTGSDTEAVIWTPIPE